MTRKEREAAAAKAERALRKSIMRACRRHDFHCRFFGESVIIETPLSHWQYQYHYPRKTLFHESTTKINFKTGRYSYWHVQFKDWEMSNDDMISFIARHERWKAGRRRRQQKGGVKGGEEREQKS